LTAGFTFPVQQSFSALLLPAVASFAQQDFPAVASQQSFLSFAAHSLAPLSLQLVMAFLLLLVPLGAARHFSLASLAWQQAGA
jgi:hypothetical protein